MLPGWCSRLKGLEPSGEHVTSLGMLSPTFVHLKVGKGHVTKPSQPGHLSYAHSDGKEAPSVPGLGQYGSILSSGGNTSLEAEPVLVRRGLCDVTGTPGPR